MRIRQSFCFSLFQPDDWSEEQIFAHARNVGYQAIDLWWRDETTADTIDRARDAGLAIASMCAHWSIEDGLNNRANHGRLEDEIRASIDYAAAHQVRGIIVFPGNRRDGLGDEEGREICVEGLQRVLPYAEEKGVLLNMELLNSKHDHPNYMCDHTAWGVALCQAAESPNMKLLYDIYHLQIMEGDIIRTITENIQWIGHFHTGGNPGRNDIDDSQELNYTAVCRAIAATDYDGYLAHEFTPKDDRLACLESTFTICNQHE
jgi:hydroxypyruvate isomerase